MSTEVECAQVDSGLTAASPSGVVEKNQNTSQGAHLDKGQDQGQKVLEKQLADSHDSGAPKSPADIEKESKENDQSSNADSAVETVKKKVVEAPPPKVNPWTKRTTGRVPVSSTNSSSQDKGETDLKKNHVLRQIQHCNMVTAGHTAPCAAAAIKHVFCFAAF